MAEKEDVVFVPERTDAPTDTEVLAEEVEQLQEDIKTDLEDLKHLTGDSRAWFWRGMLQGAGAIVGSVAMLIFLGWLLAFLGFIPGAGEIAAYISTYLDRVSR